jgi:hypothetical protein
MKTRVQFPSRRELLRGLAVGAGGFALGSLLIYPDHALGQSIESYLKKIPLEARWTLAANELVSRQVDVFKRLLDKEGREKLLEHTMKSSRGAGARSKGLADSFGLTGSDAKAAAAIIPAMISTHFGPQQSFEVEEATAERARVKCTYCALWANVRAKIITDDLCSAHSRYYWEGFAKAINPKLTSTFVKARPLGHSVCEWVLELMA